MLNFFQVFESRTKFKQNGLKFREWGEEGGNENHIVLTSV